ncbi:LysM peptidoglycan-binding domain-containing protein [Synechococcus sp. CCY 9618]|uniref:lytic transglycosylase n=1 Tax=Synechococcus sp. CCY 9618 TaxID=2815602 RepID=UPI001C2440D2|nr:LysM peptidoglycan-binding domain-containing protein [Synechococcus sp. CCY 9618]
MKKGIREEIVGRKAATPAAAMGGLASLFLTFTGVDPTAAALAQAAPPTRSVRVVKGDTLEAIAARQGVSVEDLIRLNRITSPEELQIGQELKLPASKAMVQVGAGDTFKALASRHGTTVAALTKANPGVKPDQLQVGTWLRLPPATAKPKPKAQAQAKPEAKPQPAPPARAAAQPPAPAPANPPVAQPADPPPAPQAPQKVEPVRWKFYGNTLVDWGGWKLHDGGVRVTLVQPTAAELGPVRSRAAAVAVHCNSLRQGWLVDGVWEPWGVPEPRSVAQKIVLDLCGNLTDPAGPAIPPPAAP